VVVVVVVEVDGDGDGDVAVGARGNPVCNRADGRHFSSGT
jgi:hypothetical protein